MAVRAHDRRMLYGLREVEIATVKMEADAALRETYFRDLDMIFYAGASLPQET